MNDYLEFISSGQAVLGIELGSTRIKAVLIDDKHAVIASGAFDWENQQADGIWTYSLDLALKGLAGAYLDLKRQVKARYGVTLTRLNALGVSAMMHGYLPFDANGHLLAPFRTWRNTMTLEAAQKLTDAFDFSIPQRWSVAHIYQAILNGESHVKDIRFLTTLAGYIHWQLAGQKVLGIGDASGMFPIDSNTLDYDQEKLAAFNRLTREYGFPWELRGLLPRVLPAGREAGHLTQEGAKLLDPHGDLAPGIPLCPPEGDAGTGMTATGAVAPGTGNVSAGTSIFAMVVLEKALSRVYPEIDMVTTPAGNPVAMVHCNNCTTDLNAWVDLFAQFGEEAGLTFTKNQVYEAFFAAALKGRPDAGGVAAIGYHSGEHITNFEEGQPLLLYPTDDRFTFRNFARAILLSTVATLNIGMEILRKENVALTRVLGHGGLYKTGDSGQRFTAAALNAPVSVLTTAGEGGAWGIALLAAYLIQKQPDEALGDYLDERVFKSLQSKTLAPDPQDLKGLAGYIEAFKKGLGVERAALVHYKGEA
ncbi:MAG: FGGY-family carbohydrate kinase [Eubacteriales bacterium]|nr:FGGY-family carbohydrate kinase [Eubacteriales bacterium]